jgi:hypothetical protein
LSQGSMRWQYPGARGAHHDRLKRGGLIHIIWVAWQSHQLWRARGDGGVELRVIAHQGVVSLHLGRHRVALVEPIDHLHQPSRYHQEVLGTGRGCRLEHHLGRVRQGVLLGMLGHEAYLFARRRKLRILTPAPCSKPARMAATPTSPPKFSMTYPANGTGTCQFRWGHTPSTAPGVSLGWPEVLWRRRGQQLHLRLGVGVLSIRSQVHQVGFTMGRRCHDGNGRWSGNATTISVNMQPFSLLYLVRMNKRMTMVGGLSFMLGIYHF